MLHAPASGYRNYMTGAISGVGTQGLCWSSSPVAAGSGSACFMEYRSDYVRTETGYYRSSGYSVRCVQHLQLLFQDVIK
ncbi:MAG: fibrobacter succinogenes major paralogous domain-containing protein [Alistipes sp.]|nr:fibrobacter succinogenes major paralogous domain-containing protein [Alistipes senegalensis]MCM1250593.1 fibrobacter succinogenes major paralogous domain-containing protein [Alistipes sp.]